jgi:hypothetical protein
MAAILARRANERYVESDPHAAGVSTSTAGAEDSRARAQRQAILLLVFCAGAGALSWEILWQLHITQAVGISALGTAITLATTMLGMSLGSLTMGRWLEGRAVSSPVRLYGALEGVVGLRGEVITDDNQLLSYSLMSREPF